jgi:hypothetical protein
MTEATQTSGEDYHCRHNWYRNKREAVVFNSNNVSVIPEKATDLPQVTDKLYQVCKYQRDKSKKKVKVTINDPK